MRIENNTYHPTKGSLADSWLSFLTRWGVLSLTEHTEFTEVLSTRINSWKVFSLTEHTDEQNTQHSTETLSQPISQSVTANRSLTPSPSPNGEGSDHRDTPTYSPILSSPIGVTSHTTPLSIRRGVGGEASVNSVCRRHSVGSKLCAKRLC